MNPKRLHLIVRGIVQGVCFRAYTRDEAMRLGLCGWVRNNSDGSVELVAEGSEEALGQLVQWCHVGPPSARVTGVEPQWSEAQGDLVRFSIAR